MFHNPEEYYYLSWLLTWERTAPKDGHLGERVGGRVEKNTQTARMSYVLGAVAGLSNSNYMKLERVTKRKDGNSYISKDASWMREPYKIAKGWYFEGCMSLTEKQGILKQLPSCGLASAEFARCAQDFVAGKSIKRYMPSDDEADRIVEKFQAQVEAMD